MEVGDQISKGFVPWLDGFWHFNKVSIYLSIYKIPSVDKLPRVWKNDDEFAANEIATDTEMNFICQ